MSAYSNRKVVLNKRPQGEIQDGDLVLKEEPVRDLKDGEVLIKTLWLSLDPYMRPRMNDSKGYMDPIEIGAPIVGESVGRVVESKSDNYQVGDVVTVYSGWQEYCIIPGNAEMVYKIKDQGVPLQTYLGVAGMPGRTGYCGLMYVGKPKSGETVVVAAASGPVGTVVGQTAKQEGCRVVGIAGGPEKCRYVVEELGFDACIDYKAGNLDADLAAACPNGIDVYFEFDLRMLADEHVVKHQATRTVDFELHVIAILDTKVCQIVGVHVHVTFCTDDALLKCDRAIGSDE